MIILKMSEEELNGHWDRVEATMGKMLIGWPTPSVYLLHAYRQGLLTWDQALEMSMAAIRIGTTDFAPAELAQVCKAMGASEVKGERGSLQVRMPDRLP
jgi:hypothetical protein